MRTLWYRLVQLWRTEPAVLRSGIAGAIGIGAVLLGRFVDAEALADEIASVVGVIIILGSGFAARPRVTPWSPEDE